LNSNIHHTWKPRRGRINQDFKCAPANDVRNWSLLDCSKRFTRYDSDALLLDDDVYALQNKQQATGDGLQMSEKLGNPAPLGLACFALTTFLLSIINAGLAQKDLTPAVVSSALVYGGIVQIAAGILEIKKGSTFGGVAFSSYGSFWISFALILLIQFLGIWTVPPAAIGIFLLAWTFFTFYMWIGTFSLNKALASTFTLLLLTFILLDVGHLAGIPLANVVGGYLGMACALNAWYTSAAILLNELFGRELLPLGHMKHGN